MARFNKGNFNLENMARNDISHSHQIFKIITI